MVGSQWSGKVGCFLVFFKIPSDAGNLLSNPEFQIHTIQRWSHLKTWNQCLVILDIPNFNPMKEALWYSHALSKYSIFKDGLRLYLQKKEWYVHIFRGPCQNLLVTTLRWLWGALHCKMSWNRPIRITQKQEAYWCFGAEWTIPHIWSHYMIKRWESNSILS